MSVTKKSNYYSRDDLETLWFAGLESGTLSQLHADHADRIKHAGQQQNNTNKGVRDDNTITSKFR